MSQLVEIALQYLGSPGVHYTKTNKGNSPEGFTCSGFVHYVLNQAGYDLPFLHCIELFDSFGVTIHDGLQKSGDLVFFSYHGLMPNHVEFYIDRGTLSAILEGEGFDQQKDKISKALDSTNSLEFVLGSPGASKSSVRITKLMREKKITPNPESKDSQLYNKNPIGFKRPARLMPGKRYHECFP